MTKPMFYCFCDVNRWKYFWLGKVCPVQVPVFIITFTTANNFMTNHDNLVKLSIGEVQDIVEGVV